MRVATWNVNSIRARIDGVVDWIERRGPDVLLLEETKCSDDVFDTTDVRGRFRDAGYEVAHHGANHYNGVAIASRVGLDGVTRGFADRDDGVFGEPRLLAATCAGIRMHAVYVPNGRSAHTTHWEAKVEWLHHLRSAVDVDVPTIVAGDVNVQRDDIDVYDPRRWRNRNHATPEERAALAALLDHGLRDVVREANPDAGVYTWWNHAADQFRRNRGMRIDLVLCTTEVADRVDAAWVDVAERGRPRSSDHAPVIVDLADR
ncbi:exodeoxyribonuclease III [Ilumatobacter sp.]|uniref:exodeoxyribonuclease III n=1 Tax=Ilumatobacter sp. TaxID=1967498 RepID=UPI003AF95239